MAIIPNDNCERDFDFGSETNREERNYRRGYHQGAFIAVDAIFNHGCSKEEAEEWVRRLFHWRHKLSDYRATKGPVVRTPPDPTHNNEPIL